MALASKASVAAVISITALACFAAPKAEAVQVIVGGNNYDVTTFTGDYDSNTAKFNTTDMPWWGDSAKAQAFATAIGSQLGLPGSGQFGPSFAYQSGSRVDFWTYDNVGSSSVDVFQPTNYSTEYAILTPQQPSSSSVPGPLPLFGAAAAFDWSRRLRGRLGAGRTDGLN